ncbi:glutathione S-transferase family protein [Chelatococcus asaccharovorans]|uniref:glutathione S-transferase family protein n=1 Tax=Chelatococcus asaccharovorans TaxID=28210 RepID=UPI00224C6B86|nr:glutathione S-transferase N-terminal domain-containing protein [Chelatococcus asaccharovorans]CAH1661375.1 Glutathione S-transferase family protein [Chelatococcus asaccharovorans]CAH1683493.1 Glutathione S-transferase family protein [Chelatococcus asaccharovorans]
MKLYASNRSPFVRKVLVCAQELGLADRIELVPKVVSFLNADEEVGRHNPLGQLPTLLRDDGTSLYDSGVICDFLNQQVAGATLFPDQPAARIEMGQRQAEADGLLANFMRWYGERRRADHPLTPQYVAICRGKLQRVGDAWEAAAPAWRGRPLDIGFIAIGCALAYADFRFAAEDWRQGRPQLADWYTELSSRPSFLATEFGGG